MPSALPESPAVDTFLANLRKSGLIDPTRLDQYLADLPGGRPADAFPLAKGLVRGGLLTPFQAGHLLKGKHQGFLVGGKYKVLDLLGTGGMGAVYLVEHLRLHCLYAMKVLPRERIKDPAALARFYREARATAAINHPNIVRTHDVDQDRSLHYLVMEYVDGCDLQRVLDANGALEGSAAAHLISQAAAGLQEIHDAGWVHRDVKPSNILVNRDGVVKILDLGLARFFEDAKSITQQYAEGSVIGTADYLAPELVADNNIVNIRSDIYSLGVVLYYLLAGRTPFGKGGSVAQKLLWANLREPDPIEAIRPELPRELVAVLMRMLAKDPARRFQLPSEVIEALGPWTQDPFELPADKWLPAPNAAASAYATRSGGSKPLGTTPHPRYEATQRPAARSRPGSSGGSRPQTGSGPHPQPSRLRRVVCPEPAEPNAGRRSGRHRRGRRLRDRVGGTERRDAQGSRRRAKPQGPPDFSNVLGTPPSGNPPIMSRAGRAP